MGKKNFAILGLSILFVLSVALSGTAQAYHVGVIWGSNYHPVSDPLYSLWETYEEPAMSYTASYINSIISSESGWVSNNMYGASTTGPNVYNTSSNVESSGSYDYLATFHVGDMYPDLQYGGYWYYNGMQWVWVDTGPTRHYAYYGGEDGGGLNDALPGVQDDLLYPNTGSKHRFTFIWTCTNADLIDLNGDQTYDFYGYTDTDNGTGIVGMPYAWTRTTGLSWDGYDNPDGNSSSFSSYVYLGFENMSKWLTDNSEFGGYNYGDFVRTFYSYAIDEHYSINDALNAAVDDMGTWRDEFSDSELYTGYWAHNPYFDDEEDEVWPTNWEWWLCRMRVYGNGNMELP